MPYFTLADVARLTETPQYNGPAIIDGVLNDGGLTVFLRSPNSEHTLLQNFCVRFDARELPKIGGFPCHTTRFCDVFAGETSEGLALEIESHRCCEADSQGNAFALKRFYRHALICSGLSHANIVPFLGVFSGNKFPYACVFESVGKENIVRYLARNPGASRLKLLVEIARGLHYIHDLNIVHGNLRDSNIWIDEQGAARIAGFASATIMVESNITLEDVDKSVESDLSRWYSPEVLNPGSGSNMARETKASDMYSFGMLAYAIFSGQVPFHDKTDTAAVFAVISTREQPPRPAHQQLLDQLWEMIEKCWRRDPSQRPTILEVVTFLERSHRF